jgi:copper homeostasis protein
MRLLLEVIVQSLADARAAEAGGADRLEVVREIGRDGLTPSMDLVRAIANVTRLPLRVMVRESDGFSVADARELQVLQKAMRTCAELGVDGVVVGFARGASLDLETTAAVLSAAPGTAATFHRAFDSVGDPLAAIDALKALGQVDRILTNGGSGDWAARCARFEEYAARARPRLTILAGGGIDEEGIRMLVERGSISEVHVGRAACEPPQRDAPVSAARVRALRRLAGG